MNKLNKIIDFTYWLTAAWFVIVAGLLVYHFFYFTPYEARVFGTILSYILFISPLVICSIIYFRIGLHKDKANIFLTAGSIAGVITAIIFAWALYMVFRIGNELGGTASLGIGMIFLIPAFSLIVTVVLCLIGVTLRKFGSNQLANKLFVALIFLIFILSIAFALRPYVAHKNYEKNIVKNFSFEKYLDYNAKESGTDFFSRGFKLGTLEIENKGRSTETVELPDKLFGCVDFGRADYTIISTYLTVNLDLTTAKPQNYYYYEGLVEIPGGTKIVLDIIGNYENKDLGDTTTRGEIKKNIQSINIYSSKSYFEKNPDIGPYSCDLVADVPPIAKIGIRALQ